VGPHNPAVWTAVRHPPPAPETRGLTSHHTPQENKKVRKKSGHRRGLQPSSPPGEFFPAHAIAFTHIKFFSSHFRIFYLTTIIKK
jgi:hypothetical protein